MEKTGIQPKRRSTTNASSSPARKSTSRWRFDMRGRTTPNAIWSTRRDCRQLRFEQLIDAFCMSRFAFNRRDFIVSSAAISMATCRPSRLDAAVPQSLIAVRQITRGPKHHWFGYYDKLQFDPSGRYVLGMEVDFEHRSPTADDVDQNRNGRSGGRRSLDRAWRKQGLVLATRLHAAVVPGVRALRSSGTIEAEAVSCHGSWTCRHEKVRTIPHAVYCCQPERK